MRFADRVAGLAGPGTDAWLIHYDGVARARRGEDVILLSVGDPDFPTPAAVVSAAVDSLHRGRTHYADIVGQPELRAAIAAAHARTTGVVVDADQVVVLAGAQNALFSALSCLVGPGDEVVGFAPTYVTYAATVAATGATFTTTPLRAENGFHLDPADLARALSPRTRVLLWNAPNNPTGAVARAEELTALREAALRHDLWVIADEVYASLVYEGAHASPCALPDMAERTVVVSSLSKSHAMTGWRLGWMVGPRALAEPAGNLALCMLYGSPAFIQDAATTALTGGLSEVEAMRDRYRRRRDRVCRRLENLPRVRCHRPEGGMFVMLDVRGTGLGADGFARRLLAEEGIAVLAGDAFGGPAAGHVRISLTVPEERLAEACDRISRFVFRQRDGAPL